MFFKISEKKKKILEILLTVLALIAISVISILILSGFDIISFDNGFVFNEKLFNSFKNSWYGCLMFVVFQTILTVLLCIVPGISMAFIILCTKLYENTWVAFLVSFSSVMISSVLMYITGRFGGRKVCEKILGKEDCDKSLELLTSKSTIFFPLMMIFPVFPDDALVMMAGTIKMKMKWFMPSIILGRGIGILTIVFGFSLIPFEEFDSLYDWIVFITVCIVWIFIIFHFANKLSKRLEIKSSDTKES